MMPGQITKEVLMIGPVDVIETATATANLDTLGAEYCTLRVQFADMGTNTGPTISVLECDTTVVTDFATITADQTPTTTEDTTSHVYHIDLKTRMRYLRVSITTGTSAGDDTITAVSATLSRLKTRPDTTAEFSGPSTNNTVTILPA